MDTQAIIEKNLIFKGISGSQSYGLEGPNSDTDIRGVFIAPPPLKLGIDSLVTAKMPEGDEVYVEITEIISHFAKGAPNWVELLCLPNKHIIMYSGYWDELRKNKKLFLTKSIATKGLGFIKGMQNRSLKNSDIELCRKEIMHAVRMGRMINDFLVTGKLVVDRTPERDYLLSIRSGNTSYDDAVTECGRLVTVIETNLLLSRLPERCDREKASKLAAKVTLMFWDSLGYSSKKVK